MMIWTNAYERLTWTPLLVLVALEADSPESMAYAASAYSLANLGGNLVFGSLSDRFGRYKVAGVALVAMTLTTLFHLRIWSGVLLVLIRLFHGFFAAAVTPSTLAAASDGIEWKQRGQVMARIGMTIAFASIAAPPLAGKIVEMTSLTVTLIVQALFLLAVGMAGIIVKTGSDKAHRSGIDATHTVGQTNGSLTYDEYDAPPQRTGSTQWRITLFACVVGAAIMFAQNILFYALPLKATYADIRPSVVGMLFGVFAIGSAVAFAPPFSRLADRFGRLRPVFIGCTMAAVGLFLLGRGVAESSIAMMVPSLLLYGFGFGISFPAVSASTADGARESNRGFAFGLLTASFSVGSVFGPLVSQALASVASPFTVGGVVMLIGVIAAIVTYNNKELRKALTGASI